MDNIISAIVSELFQTISEQVRRNRQTANNPQIPIGGAQRLQAGLLDLLLESEVLMDARDITIAATNACVKQLIAAAKIRYNNLLPINRLPNEVLAMIFMFSACCHTNSSYPLEARAPLNLSGVSKAWREAALDTLRLWIDIDQIFPSPLYSLAGRGPPS
ncbi:hypothetical protein BOTBODRAFT_33720 [Botryobasidium botryosum FD-172 SS1]|uniref:F-box domain-containing protein n=1 Tax=Botryobasidium botryosum (strain FD-172 SS1) TaxID=930990 RepID=A0A067MFG2_BOTB1|nr:hypothetical protein BOTBODRAFT_33720 [Botryobasidium botryosum FD-172 SS1]